MTRPAPHRDDKVLADWNGLMIAGLVRAAVLLDRPEWIAAAETAFAGALDCLGGESNLGHAYRNGRVTKPGFATDHAALALAGLAIYEATGAEHALNTAIALSQALWDRYRIDSGLLATTVVTAQDLPLRLAPTADDATPNVHGIAAESFIRLSALTGDTLWLERADKLIDAASGAVLANPFAHAALLNALDLRLRRVELTLAAPPDHPLAQAMASVPYPNRTLRHVRATEGSMPHVLVCADGRCSLPLEELALIEAEIEKAVHKGRPLGRGRR